jgi:hypothetical protein
MKNFNVRNEVDWIEDVEELQKKREFQLRKSFYGIMLIHACTFSHYDDDDEDKNTALYVCSIFDAGRPSM